MNVSELAVVDVRGPLTAQRGRLLSLLASLSDEQWAAPTAAPAWSVKDIALHLLDVDLNWIARDRDHDRAGMIPMSTRHEEFVRALGERNQRWVVGTRGLSPRLVTGLLQWAGEQLDAHLGTIDLAGPSSVYWAGEVPLWFDLAREFTERWVHYRQIREAAGPAGPGQPADEFLPLVLRTFVWGFPHQYRAPAPPGTTVGVEVPGIGAWILTRTASGWSLDEGEAAAPAARLSVAGEAAWRLLTGARYDASQVRLSGDMTLAEPLLSVRGIIVLDFIRHCVALPWGTITGSPAPWARCRSRAAGVFGVAGGGRVDGAQLGWCAARRHRFSMDRSRPRLRLVLELLVG